MNEEIIKKLEGWFIELNTPEYDNQDAGMVRDEIAEFLIRQYKIKLGMCPATYNKPNRNNVASSRGKCRQDVALSSPNDAFTENKHKRNNTK